MYIVLAFSCFILLFLSLALRRSNSKRQTRACTGNQVIMKRSTLQQETNKGYQCLQPSAGANLRMKDDEGNWENGRLKDRQRKPWGTNSLRFSPWVDPLFDCVSLREHNSLPFISWGLDRLKLYGKGRLKLFLEFMHLAAKQRFSTTEPSQYPNS